MAINPNIPLSGRPIDTTQAVPQMQDAQMNQLKIIKQQYDNASEEDKRSAQEEMRDVFKIEGMSGDIGAIGKYVSDPKNLNTQAAMEMRDEFLADQSADKGQFMMGIKARKNLAVALGFVADAKGDEGFTLSEGQQRFDAQGNKIAGVAPRAGGANGKPLPISAAKGILENRDNLRKANNALTLIQGRGVNGAAGDTAATGIKGYMPEAVLQRADPAGVDTRAAIADLGSMVVHDRSGAAVTVSEYPRLRPFIPQVTDKPEVVAQKLQRFISEFEAVNDEAENFYNESGYNVPSMVKSKSNNLPSAAVNDLLADPSPAAQQEFDQIFGDGAAASALENR